VKTTKNKGCKELDKRKKLTRKEGKERMDTVRERREYLVHKQIKFEMFCLVDCLLEK